MDWSVKSVSHESTHSGQEFNPGDVVLSHLVLMEDGDIQRFDLAVNERENILLPGVILGWWRSEVPDKTKPTEDKKRKLATVEEFFLSLYDFEEEETVPEREAMKYLLAIMLERKRVLKPVGKPRLNRPQTYIHTKEQRSLVVPYMEITPELMIRIEEQLQQFVR